MGKISYTIILFVFVLSFQAVWTQQAEQPDIEVSKDNVTFEKIAAHNYKLTVHWTELPGSYRYRVRYSDGMSEIKEAEDLTNNILTDDDPTTIVLSLQSNECFLQVLALDEASATIGESGIYRITLNVEEGAGPDGHSRFFTAFKESFGEMDPVAGLGIVALIALLFVYGTYITISLNREVKEQNPEENGALAERVSEFIDEWKDNLDDKEKLEILSQKIISYNENHRYGILDVLEKGLRNHVNNFHRENVSEEVDRDMEKSIFYELENLKLGNYSPRKKHISLIRIKMFGETAPMLGLLGTVSGLIVAFYDILVASKSGADYERLLSELSSGIYSAIVTTIIGLIIGIILLFFHHGVENNIKRLQNAWNQAYIDISKRIS